MWISQCTHSVKLFHAALYYDINHLFIELTQMTHLTLNVNNIVIQYVAYNVTNCIAYKMKAASTYNFVICSDIFL